MDSYGLASSRDSDDLTGVADSVWAITAAIVISFVGNAVILGMPVLVGAMSDKLGFDEQQVGLMASADLGGMFLASMLTATLITRLNRQHLALAGIVIAILANLLSTQFHGFSELFIIRIVAGFGGGICYSLGVGCLAGTHHTARNFSILLFTLVAINAIELYTFPMLADMWGMNGIYYAFCSAFVFCLAVIPFLPKFSEESAGDVVSGPQHQHIHLPGSLPKLCLLAVGCFYITIGAFYAYIERAGVDAGLSDGFINNTLTLGTLFALLGCAVATWMSNRFGQSKPLFVALLCMVGAMVLLASDINNVNYVIGYFAFNMTWLFTDIYQLGTISNIDHSGRYAAMIPGVQGLAQTIAPITAGFILAQGMGYGAVMFLCGVGSLAAFFVYTVVYMRLKQLAPDIADAS